MWKNILKNALLVLGFSFAGQLSFAQVGLASINENQRYSVITVTPSTEGKPEIEKLKKTIEAQVQKIADEAVKTAALGLLHPKGLAQLFVQLGQEMNRNLSPFIQEINSKLPNEDALVFSTYIMPFENIDGTVKVQMPIINEAQIHAVDIFEITKQKKSAAADFFYKLNRQILDISVNLTDEFQFVALAAHIKLIKNNVEVKLQLLGQLKTQKMDFVKSNDQVNITHLEVLSKLDESIKPMALMNITQSIDTKASAGVKLPEVAVDLGSYGGISGGYKSWRGEFQILKDAISNKDCAAKLDSVPSLSGRLAQKAAGHSKAWIVANKLLQNRPVRFRILGLKLDPETFKISDMQVATGLEGYSFLSCIETTDVNKQFMNEANAAIDNALKSIYKQDAVSEEMMHALFE